MTFGNRYRDWERGGSAIREVRRIRWNTQPTSNEEARPPRPKI